VALGALALEQLLPQRDLGRIVKELLGEFRLVRMGDADGEVCQQPDQRQQQQSQVTKPARQD
jgi:hypothetical protein